MSIHTQTKLWDFSHVIDLINSLGMSDPLQHKHEPRRKSVASNNVSTGTKSTDRPTSTHSRELAPPRPRLGDFGQVWQFLGIPTDTPAPSIVPPSVTGSGIRDFSVKRDYASDGATYSKAVTNSNTAAEWQEHKSSDELVTDGVTDHSTSAGSVTLTKAQRKKRNRNQRKEEKAAKAAKNINVSESEADVVSRPVSTPARKASAHEAVSEPTKRYNLRGRDASGLATTNLDWPLSAGSARRNNAEVPKIVEKAFPHTKLLLSTPKGHSSDQSTVKVKQPIQVAVAPQIAGTAQNGLSQQRPGSTKRTPHTKHLIPSSIPPRPKSTAPVQNLQNIPLQQPLGHIQNTPRKQPQAVIEPKVVRSGEDKDWALLIKLINDFWEDRKHLISPMNLTTHNNHPAGIHVFVDASNIFIGFTDQLKRSRNIPQGTQVPQVDLSFDALALLMERRRPVAKRVLVGSTPHLPAFDKAKAVGYECNILEKVYKARELTERQIYFNERDRPSGRKGVKAPPANNVAINGGSIHGPIVSGAGGAGGRGSETSTAQYAPARMIEQGVDEILHLKILESVVDADAPSTMVLATGDAAQAEYSQGFMAMVERALRKGWRVELVSWSRNISAMYQKREWVRAWGERFRVVFLDDYAEELLDM